MPVQTTLASQDEQSLREDLAAAYRLVDYYGMTDLIYGHLSVRISENPPVFLINPYGLQRFRAL
jgi:ribulose-5-phosphate 4-epimerase/fuculose-1-phosphate aldolase